METLHSILVTENAKPAEGTIVEGAIEFHDQPGVSYTFRIEGRHVYLDGHRVRNPFRRNRIRVAAARCLMILDDPSVFPPDLLEFGDGN